VSWTICGRRRRRSSPRCSRTTSSFEHAASSLAEIADPATTPALAGLLGDANRDIRRHAAEALGEIGTPAAVKALTRALEDRDPEVRRAAVEALGEHKEDN
jgi:HEAT repeat protein